MVFDHASDTWAVHVPAKFSGKTEGLCGLADGNIRNDLWIGSYAVASVSAAVKADADSIATFFNHWLASESTSTDLVVGSAEEKSGLPSCLKDALPETGLIAGDGSALVRTYCSQLFTTGKFAEVTDVVDSTEYIDTCVRATAGLPVLQVGSPVSADWPGCSVCAAYASAAARAGKCIEWRSENFCAYPGTRIPGSEYHACGVDVQKSCENFKTYAAIKVNFNTEGYFCGEEKVSVCSFYKLYVNPFRNVWCYSIALYFRSVSSYVKQ